jgi:outer membrane biosynthesis protein TonB
MKTGLTISAIGHAAVVLWSVVTFGIRPMSAPPVDSLPVDIISATEFSQMTAGVKTAPKAPAPKPLVEKVAEAKPPADNPADKVVDKPEIVTASVKPSEPAPEPKPQEVKPPPQAKPEPKVDPIAEALKKEEAKKKAEQKKEEAKQAPKKPPQPKFDPKQIEQKLALLDKRDGQRRAYTGESLSSTPTLGTPTGSAPQLSQNELEVLKARLRDCWRPPAGAAEVRDLSIEINIMLKQDGSLQAEPKVLNRSSHPIFQVTAESALRAVRTCAPFSFLPVAKYEAWKDIDIDFNLRDMFRS